MRELVHGSTPVPEGGPIHPGVRLFLQVGEAYKKVFAASRIAPALSRPHPVRRTGFDLWLRVDAIDREAEDVKSLTLTAPDGGQLPSWLPGAHLDVFLPSGRQRQYSLCGDPQDRHRYRIAVRRIEDGGGGSREVHDALTVGELVHVRGPRNAFRLVAAASYVFVAGGIGITPILPMVRTAHRRGIPWRLIYTGRSRETMPFLDELAEFRTGTVEVRPDDEFGTPDVPGLLGSVTRGDAVYVCGPPPMLEAARRALTARGSGYELHSERFSAPPVVGGKPFEVRLARSARTLTVGAEESVLAAVRKVVPEVAYSCQQGFCGSCKTKVLAGTVEHHGTLLLGGDADAAMLICVSRAEDGLVLDL